MKKNTTPLRTALIYAIFGALWILLSDKALEILIPASVHVAIFQTIKGWLFILVSASLLYLILNKDMKSLQGSETRYGLLFETSPVGILLANPQGQILEVNPAAMHILGSPSAEATKNINLLTFQLLKEAGISAEFQKCVETTSPFLAEHPYTTAWEKHIHLYIRFTPIIDERGQIQSVQIIMEDITERKQAEDALRESEERFRVLADLLPQIVFESDELGRLTYVNQQAFKVLGYPPDYPIRGRDSLEFYIPEDRPRAIENIKNRLLGKQEESHEYTMIRMDGSLLRVLVYSNPIIKDNKLVGLRGIIIDITERVQAAEAIQSSKQMIEDIINTIPVSVFWKDRNLVYLGCNALFARDAGFTDPQDIIGKDDYQMGWHDQAELYRGDDLQIIESREPKLNLEEPQTTPDGKSIILLTNKTPLRNSTGEVVGILGTYIDITERKLAEKALQESEEKFAKVFRDAPVWIAITDLNDATYLDVNDQALRATGFSRQEVIGHTAVEIGWLKREDRVRLVQELQDHGQIDGLEMTFHAKDGRLLLGLVNGDQIIVGGRPCLLTITVDITERKQADKILHEIIEKNPISIQIVDKEGYTLQTNDAHTKLFGAVVPPDYSIFKDKQIVSQGFIELFEGVKAGKSVKFPDFTFNIHDVYAELPDNPIWLRLVIFPLLDSAGNQERYVLMHEDITEHKQAEKTIRDYAANLEQRVEQRTSELIHANRAKDEFLANMSHELRTPLNSILGFSETLLEGVRGPLNERQEQGVKIIYSSGEHLLGLINDILDVSKIEAGKFELHPEIVSVNDICHSSLNFIKQLAKKKNIMVEYSASLEASSIVADPKRLKQILVNLLNNAVKFTPERGKVTLEVQADAERNQLRFLVTDTGIGIASDDLPRLFKPFVQLDSSLSRQYEGSGLGLVLTQKLVDLHQGVVQVESTVGKGSSFTVALPWKQSAERLNTEELFLEKEQKENKPTHQLRILLAEDNETNVMVVRDYLEDHGYQVFVAHDGAEALTLANEVLPAIILMDVQMPEMDGLEATRRLRATPGFSTIPVIALTAFAMPGDRERCLEAGANEYLSKPVQLKMLLQNIKNLTGDGL
jgi:PAS domain S-box-containing protein